MNKQLLMICLCLSLASAALGQTWRSYRLTHFPGNGQVRGCSSVMDSVGNIHTYFTCYLPDQLSRQRQYYLRCNTSGRILTDTVAVNSGAANSNPWYPMCLSDGQTTYDVFSDWVPQNQTQRGIFITAHDTSGDESLSPAFLGYGGGTGGAAWDYRSALNSATGTIHMVNISGRYKRFRTNGDTLIWRGMIDGVVNPIDPEIHIAPDGTAWAAMRSDIFPEGGTEIVIVHFASDTSQIVYRPFGRDVHHWYVDDFGIDSHYDFHLSVSCDTAGLAYARLDSNLQVSEWRTLNRTFDGNATMKSDTAGNCLFVWNDYTGLWWTFRSACGVWTYSPTVIEPDVRAYSFSIVAMDSNRIAFTAECALQSEQSTQLALYTYGYPDAVSPGRPTASPVLFSVYPNPTNGSAMLRGPLGSVKTIVMYNVLGQQVRTLASPTLYGNASTLPMEFDGLPSGAYFLDITTRTGSARTSVQLIR
jgi:hypothetical protein